MLFLWLKNQYNKCFFKAPTPLHARNVSVNIRYISIWLITCCSLLIINHKVLSILYYYSILARWNGVNFQGIIVILCLHLLLCLSIGSKRMLGRDELSEVPQKHFQFKFINIAIYCNTLFDIAIISQYVFWAALPIPTCHHPIKRH